MIIVMYVDEREEWCLPLCFFCRYLNEEVVVIVDVDVVSRRRVEWREMEDKQMVVRRAGWVQDDEEEACR